MEVKLESTKNSMVAKWTLVGDRCSKDYMPHILINELFHGAKHSLKRMT
jgi:hypothetical protein